ncbi:hypothetical protein [Pseudomonas sp. MF7451]|uniref:hypothetical protein n=1 Tax=Pseudomonas sp. MF7451 TaxID=2797538 RepID=UPI0018E81A40|nr:hypothetical protein [Pseudomonas sp. MF7451]
MPEVHRYQVVTMLSMAGATIGYDPHGPDVVMASDFDNATRLFLDAAERCIASERREKELQQRLTAADERADVLEVLVGEVLDAVGREPLDLDAVLRLRARMRAALKPAEGVGDDTTLEEDREDFKKVFVRINTKQGQSISLADMIARYEKKP